MDNSRRRKVLVVDDDLDTLETLKVALEAGGYEVVTARDAAAGLAAVSEEHPDLILLNVMMPHGTEGFHFVWRLRSEYPDHLKDTPILVLTSIHSSSRLRFFPEQSDGTYGPGEFLPVQEFGSKPVDPRDLLERIQALLAADTKKILIVDDDADAVEALKMALEASGYVVATAHDPAQGLAAVERECPDLILLDIMMPRGTEGFHFVWKLRGDYPPPMRDIPVLVISSLHSSTRLRFYPDQDDGTYGPGEFLPVQGFVDKPVDPSGLLTQIAQLLS